MYHDARSPGRQILYKYLAYLWWYAYRRYQLHFCALNRLSLLRFIEIFLSPSKFCEDFFLLNPLLTRPLMLQGSNLRCI